MAIEAQTFGTLPYNQIVNLKTRVVLAILERYVASVLHGCPASRRVSNHLANPIKDQTAATQRVTAKHICVHIYIYV